MSTVPCEIVKCERKTNDKKVVVLSAREHVVKSKLKLQQTCGVALACYKTEI